MRPRFFFAARGCVARDPDNKNKCLQRSLRRRQRRASNTFDDLIRLVFAAQGQDHLTVIIQTHHAAVHCQSCALAGIPPCPPLFRTRFVRLEQASKPGTRLNSEVKAGREASPGNQVAYFAGPRGRKQDSAATPSNMRARNVVACAACTDTTLWLRQEGPGPREPSHAVKGTSGAEELGEAETLGTTPLRNRWWRRSQ